MGSATYEAVAATRPRIRRDVLFTETADGVLFHNADGGFQLTAKSAYRFATLIVPHLTGDHSVAEICDGLGDRQRAMVGELVNSLYEREFARAVPPGGDGAGAGGAAGPEAALAPDTARRYAPQIAYADHYADDAEARFARFRTARVAVAGDDLVARWCALSLVRNGCATIGLMTGLDAGSTAAIEAEAREAESDGCPVDLPRIPSASPRRALTWADFDAYDIVVVTGGASAPGRLFPLLRAGVPEGRTLLPAWSYDGQAVVGPLMAPGTVGCWACAALRVGSHGEAAAAADLWSALALPGVPPVGEPPSGPLSAMIGNLLGYEVFRLTTGALPAETEGRLVIQDLKSLDVTSEPLLPHPRCPFCGSAGEPGGEGGPGGPGGARATAPERAPEDAAAPGTGPGVGHGVHDGTVADADPDPLGDAPGADHGADSGVGERVDVGVDLTTAGSTGPRPPTVATAREADAIVAELGRRSVLVAPRAGVFTRFADESLTQLPLKASLVEFTVGHGASRRVAAVDVHHVAGARLRALDAAAEVYAEHVASPRGLVTSRRLRASRSAPRTVRPGALALAAGTGATEEQVTAWTGAASLIDGARVLVPAGAARTFGPHNADRLFEPSRAGVGAGATPADAAADGLLSALAYDALCRTLRGGAARRVDPAAFTDGPAADAELTFLLRSAAVLEVDLELLDLGEADRSGVHVMLARGAGGWAIGSETGRLSPAAAAVRDLLGRVQLDREGLAEPFDTGDPLLRDLDAGTVDVVAPGTVPDTWEGTDRAATPWAEVLDRLRGAGRDAFVVRTGGADLATAGISTARVLLTVTETSRGV
ncbi:hypothetical protein GCM10009654_66730 [Streptomyces hebeiensis]|uniref:YcaO domain-containing protein n=1 Tax=Streptomyces hebeiensis TaxID=229486 RepID=A0ABP4FU79_9ACTN